MRAGKKVFLPADSISDRFHVSAVNGLCRFVAYDKRTSYEFEEFIRIYIGFIRSGMESFN